MGNKHNYFTHLPTLARRQWLRLNPFTLRCCGSYITLRPPRYKITQYVKPGSNEHYNIRALGFAHLAAVMGMRPSMLGRKGPSPDHLIHLKLKAEHIAIAGANRINDDQKEQNYKFLKLRLLHLCHAAWPWTEVSDAIFCHTAAWIATQDHTTKNLFGPGKLLVLDGNGASKTKMHFRVLPLNFEGRATSNEKLHCSSRPLCECLQ